MDVGTESSSDEASWSDHPKSNTLFLTTTRGLAARAEGLKRIRNTPGPREPPPPLDPQRGLAARAEGLKRIRKTIGPWEAPPRSPLLRIIHMALFFSKDAVAHG